MESAQRQLQTFSESFGLSYFRLCIQARRPSNDYVRVEFSNLSRMWVDRYRRCNYAKIDPVLALLDDANEPFAWDAIDRQNIEVRRYLEDAAFHGLVDGFTVPLHCSNGESAHLTLAGAALTTDIEERWAMYAATYRFQWTAFSSLRPLLLRLPGPPSTTLTDKQRQILVLLMQGMGVKSIARTLGLHARTVDDGLRRACLRLGVTSREQAIVRALATRQIDPAELVPPPPPPIEFHLNATRR
ncbi:regulatory LuxR family protein [Panacagrimonas perspica]|uniref:Regulatory LuxR family protein n=1 Tax=Panacagrimonas perspica TaxID=381431 RepID=A0A4R7PAN5_9GAMM|nr:LuxR family transcriptional regulator [Panacagrimonas perspica]TDU30692.1 regulatory LuxR family protein [Panacagrimonas perspica]THD01523.1 hypothetical protein B1810_18520 [Panacagrimonas perspica]